MFLGQLLSQDREEVENRLAEIEESQQSIFSQIGQQNNTDEFVAEISEDIEQLKAHIKTVDLKSQERVERCIEIDACKQMVNSIVSERTQG